MGRIGGENRRFSFSSKRSMSAPSSANSSREFLFSNLPRLKFAHIIRKAKLAEPEFSVFRTVKKHYIQAVDYRTYGLSNCFRKYNGTFSSYIAKNLNKMKLQVKAHFFNAENLF